MSTHPSNAADAATAAFGGPPATTFFVPSLLMREPLVALDSAGRIRAANPAFVTLLEGEPEILGTHLGALTSEGEQTVATFIAQLGAQPGVGSVRLTLRTARGPRLCECRGVLDARSMVAPNSTITASAASATVPADPEENDTGKASIFISFALESPLAEAVHAASSVARADIGPLPFDIPDAGEEREGSGPGMRGLGDGIVIVDPSGRIRFVNATGERLTGWSLAEARGRPLGQVFHLLDERTRERIADPIEQAQERAVALDGHRCLMSRDGRAIPVEGRAAPIRNADGSLDEVVLEFRDRSARYAMESQRSWLAAIIESSDDAIASKTLDGIVTSWNRGAVRLFGWTPEEIIGRPITTIIPPELHEQEREILRRLRAGERVDHFDTVRMRKDGTLLEISLTVSPIRNGSGAIVGASKVARDITERKRLERELRLADRRKDEFLATLAHELRNPLAPIRSAADLIARTELPGPARAACQIVERQVSQLSHLVDELLDVARITTGRIRLAHEPLDLREVVSMAVESSRPAIERKRHTLTITMPDEPATVLADRMRLIQVFGNILANAAKYTAERGHIEILLRVEGEQALVSVRDNGIGIDPERLDEVFELFTQLNRSYTDTTAGLGIGLALAQRLVQLHGGSIQPQSAGAGLGSCFTVRLPVAQLPLAPVLPKAPLAASGRRRRVLIADDNQDAARSLAMLLEMLGHETRMAFDGASALKVAEEFLPEVALLDIGMPAMSGYEVARAISARPWSRGIELVALTGWGQESDRNRAREAGFHRHLVKPVSLETLSGLLAEERSSARPAAPMPSGDAH